MEQSSITVVAVDGPKNDWDECCLISSMWIGFSQVKGLCWGLSFSLRLQKRADLFVSSVWLFGVPVFEFFVLMVHAVVSRSGLPGD